MKLFLYRKIRTGKILLARICGKNLVTNVSYLQQAQWKNNKISQKEQRMHRKMQQIRVFPAVMLNILKISTKPHHKTLHHVFGN
jgi:hypothetical protein